MTRKFHLFLWQNKRTDLALDPTKFFEEKEAKILCQKCPAKFVKKMEAYEHLKSEHAIKKRDLPQFVTTIDLKKRKLDEMCKQSKSQMKGSHEFECPFCQLGKAVEGLSTIK